MSIKVSGSYTSQPPKTVTTTYTLSGTDSFLVVNSATSVTVTLPAASGNSGRTIYIKSIGAGGVISATANVVPLSTATAGTAILTTTAGKYATLVSDSTNWVIMAAN